MHCPPLGIDRVALPGQVRSHAELPQVTEQSPRQVTWQVDPPVQATRPLAPMVTVHSESPSQLAFPFNPKVKVHLLPPLHSLLQSPSQVPLQVLWSRQ